MVRAYENYWRVGRIEKKLDGLWIGGGEIEVLAPILLRHHAWDEKRLGDVPGKMAERLLRDSPRLLFVRRDAALDDILYGNPAALRHKRPETGRKTGSDVIGMFLENVQKLKS